MGELKDALDGISEHYQYLISQDINILNRTLYLNSSITSKSSHKLIKKLELLDSLDDKAINLVINTQGGVVADAFAIIDTIEQLDCEVIGIARGEIYSSGLPILVSCDYRKAYKRTMFMHHALSYGASRSTLSEHEVDYKYSKELQQMYNQTLAEHTNEPFAFWSKHKSLDFFFNAEQALEMGVIDEIIGKSDE